jgi:SAM-dependent methyltransferase
MADDQEGDTGEPRPRRLVTGRLRAGLAELAVRCSAGLQRRVWSRRAASWDQHPPVALAGVTSAVIGAAAVRPGEAVVDLGCGTGQISIPLALKGAVVLAVDVSPVMSDLLRAEARSRGLTSLTVATAPVERLALPPASLDLVVTSYALHHVRDADKGRLVRAAYGWLRPGGRLVIADMMLGRGRSARDREIIRAKLGALARKGPGGWWRIAKNAARYLLRIQERPISMAAWSTLLETAGFTAVAASSIIAEAGLVTGRRPAAPADTAERRIREAAGRR